MKTPDSRVGPHYWRRHGGEILLTNDPGEYLFLSKKDFAAFIKGGLPETSPAWAELKGKGFIRDGMDFSSLAARYASVYLDGGAAGESAHTIEVTRRCNQTCVYCSASAKDARAADSDMDLETARKTADFILAMPSQRLYIEFQGGEPLLNWPVVRFLIDYLTFAVERGAGGRSIHFSLISNFTAMDAEKLDYLGRRGVNLCTSLDGPAAVHDANRTMLGGSSHESVAAWLRVIQQMLDAGFYPKMSPPNAVATVTRASLGHAEAIVDEFWRLGLERIQLGPIEPFGRAARAWGRVGLSAEEFLEFYRGALTHIVKLCRHRPAVYEKGAAIFLRTIFGLKGAGSRWTEGISQLAYDAHGGIYPSDEGRLLAAAGDDTFRLGDVHSGKPVDLLASKLLSALVLWNLRSASPRCSQCAYSPFCQSVRLSPAHHQAEQGRPWGQIPSSRRCTIFLGVFDDLFEKLRDPETEAIFRHWAGGPA